MKACCLAAISRQSFCRFCVLLYEKDLVAGGAGNVSARFRDGYLVTPSGFSLRDVSPETTVFVKPDGRHTPGDLKPSKEFAMHLGIYRRRPDVNVVCHIHGAYIIAASTMAKPGSNTLPPLTPGFACLAYPLPMEPFLVPGTVDLAKAVSRRFSPGRLRALLLQNHGLITVGANIAEAFNIAEEVNENAMIHVLTGGRGTAISKADAKRIW